MNIEELKYKEVKSMMAEIIQAISKSKDKVWQLLGVFFCYASVLNNRHFSPMIILA